MKKLFVLNNYIIVEDSGVKTFFPTKETYIRKVEKSYFITHLELETKVLIDGSDSIDENDVQYTEETLLEFLTSFSSAGSSAGTTTGNFIPLPGTEEGKPVTGDVRFLGDTFDYSISKLYVRRDTNLESGIASESSIIFGGDTDKSGIVLKTENLDNGDISEIGLLEGSIEIISATNQILVNGVSFDQINGIIGDSDFSAVDTSNPTKFNVVAGALFNLS